MKTERTQVRFWIDNDLLEVIDNRTDGTQLSDHINNIIRKELLGAKNEKVLHKQTSQEKS